MPVPDDVRQLRLTPSNKARKPRCTGPPRHRKGERFLMGPIPWRWLQQALKLSGRALHVALLIWLEAGIRKSASISLSLSRGSAETGCDRATLRRGLRALEEAGLVRVVRHPGRKPRVELLEGDGGLADAEERGGDATI